MKIKDNWIIKVFKYTYHINKFGISNKNLQRKTALIFNSQKSEDIINLKI